MASRCSDNGAELNATRRQAVKQLDRMVDKAARAPGRKALVESESSYRASRTVERNGHVDLAEEGASYEAL